MSPRWPEPGRCGACTRPARRFPSGRWEHDGVPCALRSGTLARPGDLPLPPAVFVPADEALPTHPGSRWESVVTETDDTGFPIELGLISPSDVDGYWDRVREQLRAEAESRGAS